LLLNERHAGGGAKPPPAHLFRRWLLLLLGILLIAGFVVIAPRLERLPLVGSTIQILRESGIYVGGWYWDMVDEVTEAERAMRRTLGRSSQEQK
jgi:hypothetical protein